MRKNQFREMARACGLQTYHSEKRCPRGNRAPRLVSTCGCTCRPCKDARTALTKARYYRKWGEIREKRLANYKLRASEYCDKGRALRRNDPELRARGVEDCRTWREKNPGRINQINAERIARDPEAHKAACRLRYALSPDGAKAKARTREIAKGRRSPNWNPELDRFVLRECYELARLRLAVTGVRWEVDHMLPMRGLTVSGLHCAANLQVIPAELNRYKGQHAIMTEPFEWLQFL